MERRRAVRRSPAPTEPLSRVRLRTGHNLDMVDISDWGALVEGAARLLPGTHVDVHVVLTDGRVLIRCRVARSFVHRVEAEAIRYRSALAFEKRIETALPGYQLPDAFDALTGSLGTVYPAQTLSEGGHLPSALPHHDLRRTAQPGTAFG